MRVCMVAYTFYEGDNRVRRYAESLVRRGDTVDAVVLRQKGHATFTRVSGVNVYKIQNRNLNEKKKTDYLLKLLMFLIRSAAVLTRLHLKKRYDLIHVHSVPDFEVFAALIPKLTGTKIILDIHDIVPELFASKFKACNKSVLFKLLVGVEKLSTAFADHVIVANHIWHKRLIKRSVSSKKCTVVMNYPDPHIFKNCKSPSAGTGIKSKKYVLSYPGTLSLHQGLETAIRAVNLLRNEIPELEFHIQGKGTDEQYFLNLVKELGLEEKVVFKGIVPIELLPEQIRKADLGVEPKLKVGFGNEAFSTKILEFMLMGIPVVASDTLVHRYYFTDDQIRFFRSGDHHDMARRILEMRKSKKLRSRMIENGTGYMKENNWDAKKEIYHAIIDEFRKKKK